MIFHLIGKKSHSWRVISLGEKKQRERERDGALLSRSHCQGEKIIYFISQSITILKVLFFFFLTLLFLAAFCLTSSSALIRCHCYYSFLVKVMDVSRICAFALYVLAKIYMYIYKQLLFNQIKFKGWDSTCISNGDNWMRWIKGRIETYRDWFLSGCSTNW